MICSLNPVGIVQFIGSIEQEQSEEAAIELLSHFSPHTDHPILGFERWIAELITVDEESLGDQLMNLLWKVIESGFRYDCLLAKMPKPEA